MYKMWTLVDSMSIREVELYPAIHELLSIEDGIEIFTEVLVYSKRPDIVTKSRCGVITIIEMKTSLNKDLIKQALNWTSKANNVYVAVPSPKRSSGLNAASITALQAFGIGVIVVDLAKNSATVHTQCITKPISEYNTKFWNKKLLSIYKDNVAGGTSGGGYMTPYRNMINSVKRYLITHPYSTMRQIIQDVPEVSAHYRRPFSSLAKAIRDYEKGWCCSKLVKNTNSYYANIKRTPIKI